MDKQFSKTRLKAVSAFMLMVAALVASCGRPSGNATPAVSNASSPNVVVILLDAFRADRIGAERNGIPVTPALNRFAAESLRFTQATSPCSWTKPSMASLFTGLYVDAHQVFYTADRAEGDAARSDALPETLDTMAEWMKGNGYETLGLQTNANLTAELGFSQGFDNYLFENCARADWVTGRATEHLKNLKKPFFLYMHFMDPHAPFDPPESHHEVFGPLPAISPEEQAIVDQSIPYVLDVAYDTMGLVAQRRFPTLSPEGRETIQTRYDADCRYMDDELGKFLAAMRAEYPNTLFVVLADHGEEFWEHNSLGHGHTVYQEQIAVPFFIHGPGIQPGEVTQPAGTINLLPTLAAYLKCAPQPNWQGRDLLAGIEPDAPAFTTTHGAFPRVKIHKEAARVGSMKLIFQPETGDEKLYDLTSDPVETTNLAAAQPETVARLRALLTQHLKDNYSHRKGKRNEVRLSPEVLEQLRLNGYGGQDEPASDGGDKPAQ